MTPTRYETFLHVRRFGSLDGLRCLSILAVLWHHAGIPNDIPLLHRGQMGVHLFFAISGFLITTLMIRERRRTGTISLRRFYARRTRRIFPLYYAVLACYVVIVYALDRHSAAGREFFRNLPWFATYTSNWFVTLDGRVIFYFAWSLAVEEQFYLTWPWVEQYCRPALKMTLLIGLIGIVAANHFGLLIQWLEPGTLAHKVLWDVAPAILMGVLASHVAHSERGFAVLWWALGRRWSAPAVLALVVDVLSLGRIGPGVDYAAYLGLVALVVACSIREDNGLVWLLGWGPIARIGLVSYGIYLLHMLALNAAGRGWRMVGVDSRWAVMIVGGLLAYGAAEVSYRTLERAFRHRAG